MYVATLNLSCRFLIYTLQLFLREFATQCRPWVMLQSMLHYKMEPLATLQETYRLVAGMVCVVCVYASVVWSNVCIVHFTACLGAEVLTM